MVKWTVLAALAAFVGCADEEADPSPMLIVGLDGGGGAVEDAFNFEPVPDEGVAPDPDRGVDPPDPDRGVEPDPDRGVDPPDPDQGVTPLEQAIATVTVVEQPDTAQLSVAVSRFMETPPTPGDCQVVAVDPDDQATPVPQLAAGPITVEGVSGGPFTFSLVGGTYQADRGIPDDLFGNGSTVRAHAGGALPFDLEIAAPAEVVLQNPIPFDMLPANQDLVVRWNGTAAEAALITVFPVDFNGPIEGDWIFCAADDSGIFTIEGADLRRAVGAGIPGLPNALVAVTRIRTISRDSGSNRTILTVTTSNGAPVILE